jgi:hypothetical protein
VPSGACSGPKPASHDKWLETSARHFSAIRRGERALVDRPVQGPPFVPDTDGSAVSTSISRPAISMLSVTDFERLRSVAQRCTTTFARSGPLLMPTWRAARSRPRHHRGPTAGCPAPRHGGNARGFSNVRYECIRRVRRSGMIADESGRARHGTPASWTLARRNFLGHTVVLGWCQLTWRRWRGRP